MQHSWDTGTFPDPKFTGEKKKNVFLIKRQYPCGISAAVFAQLKGLCESEVEGISRLLTLLSVWGTETRRSLEEVSFNI